MKLLIRLPILLLFSFSTFLSFSQGKSDENIFKLMDRRDIRFTDIDSLAKKQFDITGKGRGSGNKQYERWKYEKQFHLNKDGFILPADYDAQQYSQSALVMPAAASVAWTELGPSKWTRTTSWNPGVGRITSIAAYPANQNIIYVTSPGGGIWKTITGGGTWLPLADQNNAMMDMWSVAVDKTDPNLVYAGNGAGAFLKSADGGSTWISKSLTVSTIRKILIDPVNSNTLWVVGNNGIASSIDQGATWVVKSTLSTEDIEFKPGDTQVMYAAGSSSSAFHRSTDGGSTWTSYGSAQGITNTGRALVSVSAANPERVYVVQANGSEFGRMYRSDNSGGSFVTTIVGNAANGTNFFGYNTDGRGTGGQAWYDMAMTVNPSNADEVHIAGIICWKSTNAAVGFVPETAWSLPNNIGYNHADVHVLEWVGANIFSGSDGGIYKSVDYGDNWIELSNGLGIRQFYRISNSKTDSAIVTGGAQDNGSSILKSTGWIDWLGADGMDCVISPLNPNTIIGTSQYGSLYKTTNGGTSYSGITAPATGNWVTPLAMESNSNNLYVGWNGVYKSTDLGVSWQKISGTTINSNVAVLAIAPSNPSYVYASIGATVYITKNGGSSWNSYTAPSSVSSIAVHPSNPEKVWISCSNTVARIYVSTNACSTYTNISGNLPAMAARSVVVDGASNEGLYVGMNVGVYYTNKDLGSWINITDNLPQVGINEVELQISGNKLRVATYGRGVWERPIFTTCGIPSTLLASAITTSSAKLSWTGLQNAVSYSVEHRISGTTGWTTPPAQSSIQLDLTGLTPGTSYDWRVAVNCAEGTGPFVQSTFKTAIVCNAPAGLNSGTPASTSTTLRWNAVTGASTYDVDILPNGGVWTSKARGLATTSYNLTGLTQNTGYTWRIRSNCGTLSGYSGYSEATFTTAIQPCTDTYESNNTIKTAKTILARTNIKALISTATDVDHFKISMGTNLKIKVTLSNLPAAYNVQIMNSSGVVLQTGSSGSSIAGGTRIVYFNGTQSRQTYYIKVSGVSGAFNSSSCYNLYVENGNINYSTPVAKAFSSEALNSGPVMELSDFRVYPIPAKSMINVVYPSTMDQKVSVKILDASGALVRSIKYNALEGINNWQVNLSGLSKSIYYLVVIDATGKSIQKQIMVE